MNRICLAGRLAADPEVVKGSEELKITRIRVAVDEWVKGERESYFFNVTTFGPTARASAGLTSGASVAVDGRIRTRTYQTKEGENRRDIDIVADRVDFLSPKPEGGGRKAEPQAKPAADEPAPW